MYVLQLVLLSFIICDAGSGFELIVSRVILMRTVVLKCALQFAKLLERIIEFFKWCDDHNQSN